MTVHWNKKIMTKELRKMSSFNIFSVAMDKQIKSLHAVRVSQPQKSKCLNNWKPKSHHSYEADLSREYINALPSSIDQNWWSTYYILQPRTIWFHSNSWRSILVSSWGSMIFKHSSTNSVNIGICIALVRIFPGSCEESISFIISLRCLLWSMLCKFSECPEKRKIRIRKEGKFQYLYRVFIRVCCPHALWTGIDLSWD